VSYLIARPGATGDGGAAAGAPALRAWDPIERRVLWSVTESLPISSRTLVTAGGLVFYVTADGWLKGLDARTGRLLWKHKVDDELQEPLSFRGIDGHQCIAVRSVHHAAAGRGSATGHGQGNATLLLFALPH
jgi:glucose dehydrogenase